MKETGYLDDYSEYYNTDRLHLALDIDNYKTSIMAFRNKAATDDIRSQNFKWTEADIMDDGQSEARHDSCTTVYRQFVHYLWPSRCVPVHLL